MTPNEQLYNFSLNHPVLLIGMAVSVCVIGGILLYIEGVIAKREFKKLWGIEYSEAKQNE